MFTKANLEGKQIWYFTVPASIPISSIQQTSLRAVENSEVIFSSKIGKYGFTQDSAEDKIYSKIMVPRISEDGYCTGRNLSV
jgi:hypothetical protein